MDNKRIFTEEELHYLRLLARQYPTVEAAGTEIIRLQAILNLPKPYRKQAIRYRHQHRGHHQRPDPIQPRPGISRNKAD